MRWSPGPCGDSAAVGGLVTHGSELGRSATQTIMSWIDTLETGERPAAWHDKIRTWCEQSSEHWTLWWPPRTSPLSSLNWFLIQTAPHHTMAGWHATMTSSELIGMDMNSFNTSQDLAVILDQKYLNHFKGAAPALRPSLAYQPSSSRAHHYLCSIFQNFHPARVCFIWWGVTQQIWCMMPPATAASQHYLSENCHETYKYPMVPSSDFHITNRL